MIPSDLFVFAVWTIVFNQAILAALRHEFFVGIVEGVCNALHQLVLQIVVAAGNVDGSDDYRSSHEHGVLNIRRVFWIGALPDHRQRPAAKRLVRLEVGPADQRQPVQRIESAIVDAHAIGPFVIAWRIEHCRFEAVEPIQDFGVMRIVATRGAAFCITDEHREIDRLPVHVGNHPFKAGLKRKVLLELTGFSRTCKRGPHCRHSTGCTVLIPQARPPLEALLL